MSNAFEGQKLIVIGGTSGIGLAVAGRVLAGGGSAVVIGHRQARIEAAVAALAGHGEVFALQADLADPSGVQRLQDGLAQDHADAGLLVNAAGVFEPKPFLEHTPRDYDLYADLNRATFFITQGIARRMVASGRPGAIVNIGSMWARQAIKATPSSAYSMAKAGLHSLTQHLAMELAPHGITNDSFRRPRYTRRYRASTISIPSVALARPGTWRRWWPSCSANKRAGSPARSGTWMAG
jgi:NAD(P)-dependent dehydrogenase (short-subunit alcohol dehydrogenase family)